MRNQAPHRFLPKDGKGQMTAINVDQRTAFYAEFQTLIDI